MPPPGASLGSRPNACSIPSVSSVIRSASLIATNGVRAASAAVRRAPSGEASAARFMVGANRSVHTSRHTSITMNTLPAGIVRRPRRTGRSGPFAGAGCSLDVVGVVMVRTGSR